MQGVNSRCFELTIKNYNHHSRDQLKLFPGSLKIKFYHNQFDNISDRESLQIYDKPKTFSLRKIVLSCNSHLPESQCAGNFNQSQRQFITILRLVDIFEDGRSSVTMAFWQTVVQKYTRAHFKRSEL